MKTTQENITIDLAYSSNAIAFKGNNIIHITEFEKIKNEIELRVKKASVETTALDTITIFGSRGSGKTSFLKSLQEYYHGNNEIEVLKIIDPTMIEDKGHVFLTIISQIKVKVDKKFQNIECSKREGVFVDKEEWRKKLLKLSAGLPSIENISTSMDGWQDPEYIMDKGFKGVESAMDLASNFQELVKIALRILGKNMFILILDDVDIDFPKGWPVLETVRKYLTTPYITTIVSGDLRLFSKAIRKKQWSNFGKALLINEGEKLKRLPEYNGAVTEMEGQYLQKVLKPQYRIKLNTLVEKYRLNEKFKVEVKLKSAETVDLNEYYSTIISRFGINNAYQKDCYITFLLGLPLRTQIQFLLKSEEIENPMGIIEVFLSELYEKDIDVDLATAIPKFTTSVILDTLVKNKVLDDGYQLQPISTDLTMNSTYMAFTMLYSILITKNKFLIFDYFVKIGYIRNLLSILGYNSDERLSRYLVNGRVRHSLCIEDLISHSSITKDRNTRDTMCYTTAFMGAYFNPNATTFTYSSYIGAVALRGLAGKARTGDEDAARRLDGAFKNKDMTSQQIAYIPASMSQGDKQTTVLTYSIYVLLGAISEIIKVYQTAPDEVDKSIQQMSQIRAYPMPNGVFNDEKEKEELEYISDDSVVTVADSDDSSSLSTMIIEWLDTKDLNLKVSPHVLGKISTRIYYTIKSIETSVKSEEIGEAMRRRIIAVMNSILIEDVKENVKDNLDVSNNNPISADDLFISNLKKVNAKDNIGDSLNFSRWMLSCPLLLLYLDYSNSNFKDELTKYITNKITCEQLFEKSIYETLQNVEVRNRSERAITKIEFNHYRKGIDKTILAISNNMDYESFESMENSELISRLKQYFNGTITIKGINKVRKHIVDNNKQW